MEQVEIYKSAWQMLTLYGVGAADEAERRARALADQGDTDGHAHWHRILAAIQELIEDGDVGGDGRHGPKET
jgi:hypothetical protein